MLIIIALILAALLLATGEIMLPGGILGVLSLVAVGAATWQAVELYGPFMGVLIFIGSATVIVVWLFVFFKFVQRTGMSKGIFLNDRIEGHSRGANPENIPDDIIGREAETLTTMAPSGMISVNGVSYEAFSQSGFMEKGEPCKVIGKDNFRVIVKSLK